MHNAKAILAFTNLMPPYDFQIDKFSCNIPEFIVWYMDELGQKECLIFIQYITYLYFSNSC